MDVELYEGERLDDLHRNGYKIIQDPKKFCFGMDAVLLSGFAKVKEHETAIDLGTGTGIIPILLEAKNRGKKYVGLEIQESSALMARRSVQYNHLENVIEIVQGDIKDVKRIFGTGCFQVVTSNPPYMDSGNGLVSKDMPKAIARHEILCNLEDVIAAASTLLKANGRFYMVHRPHRLVDIITLCRKYKLEPKRLQFVYPYVDKEPNMILIECIKGAKAFLKMEPPLIVYEKDQQYTNQILGIYGYETR